jgi:hypothetical protein
MSARRRARSSPRRSPVIVAVMINARYLRWHRLGERQYLGKSCNRPLGTPILSRTPDETRILDDDFVSDRRLENGAQKPVALGDRRAGERSSTCQLSVPPPHNTRRDSAQFERPERRQDVVARIRLVVLPGTRPYVRMVSQPRRRERGQVNLPGTRVNPRATSHVRFGGRQPVRRRPLRDRGCIPGNQTIGRRVAVAGLPAS